MDSQGCKFELRFKLVHESWSGVEDGRARSYRSSANERNWVQKFDNYSERRTDMYWSFNSDSAESF